MASIATLLRLSATAWLALHGLTALAFDARSPFGEFGRDDWHAGDRNWDGSPTQIIPRPGPAKPMAIVRPAASKAATSLAPRSAPAVLLATNTLPSGGSAPSNSAIGNAIGLVNNVVSNNLSRGVSAVPSIADSGGQTAVPSFSGIHVTLSH